MPLQEFSKSKMFKLMVVGSNLMLADFYNHTICYF